MKYCAAFFLTLVAAPAAAASPASSAALDAELQAVFQANDVHVSMLCDDATFLRRASLDLLGRIPTLAELDQFLSAPNRGAWIDKMLQDPLFSRRVAEVWTAALVGYTRETEADRVVLLQWLAQELEQHRSFKDIALSLLTAQGQAATDGPVNFVVRHGEDMGVQVSRQFLGIRLDCARCHDHPFARWTQEDFAAMNRFFEPVRFQELSERNIVVRDAPMRTEQADLPRFLSGAQPRTSQWRAELALFTTRSKPFARNFVNRVWYDLMGRGIVNPPDEFHPENPPISQPLLELLAADAKAHDFDIRRVYRLICNSQAYQRKSSGQATKQEIALFAKREVKPLTPEQVYDSYRIAQASAPMGRNDFVQQYYGETTDEDFLQTWRFRETIQTMLERVTGDFDSHPKSSTQDTFRRILSRAPTPAELQLCNEMPPQSVAAALLQTNEFLFNH